MFRAMFAAPTNLALRVKQARSFVGTFGPRGEQHFHDLHVLVLNRQLRTGGGESVSTLDWVLSQCAVFNTIYDVYVL